MRFSKEFVTEVKHSVDLVKLVNESLDLKKAGKNFLGLCPFHPDQSPSLRVFASVNGKPGGYRCYACQANGDAFDWAKNFLNLPFYEAVIFLAQRSGVPIPVADTDSKEVMQKKRLTNLLQRALSIYQHGLSKSKEQLESLKVTRRLTQETISKWQLGLVSKGITPYLKADECLLVDSGLSGISSGHLFERLRMRITIPIYAANGFLIGFAGRRIDSSEPLNSSIPKYLNPPENLLFSKSRVLFGLNHAGSAIRKADRAVVVEGYFDVISLDQAGEPCSVAGMGTAFTAEQFQLLTRYTKKISFCFDGDNAGRRSAALLLKTLLPLLEDGMELSLILLPDGEDPDSFVNQFGLNQWKKLCSDAMPLSEFILQEVSSGQSPNSVESRVHILLQAKQLLTLVKAPLFREVLSQAISERYGVNLLEDKVHGTV